MLLLECVCLLGLVVWFSPYYVIHFTGKLLGYDFIIKLINFNACPSLSCTQMVAKIQLCIPLMKFL